MNERNNRKLDAMSHIDDELIEKSTQKRIFLLKRAKKRKTRRNIFISVGASAASFFMILGVILAIVLLFSNIPVYTGMTVSGEPPVAAVQETVAMPKVYPRTGVTAGAMRVTPFTALTGGLDLLSEETSDVFEETTDVFEETTDVFEEYTDIFKDHTDTSEETTDATEKRKIAYHATVGEDIYITVHIDNPENFAILQFTLNGKVYNSYMFEEGSDMENLVLKYNVGNEPGYFEYTIDAIKYVDGTEIKDVRMKGDRTITVAVEGKDPFVVRAQSIKVTALSVSATFTFDDKYGLIEKSDGHVYAVIFKGDHRIDTDSLDNALAKQEITSDNRQEFCFEGLEPQTEYTAAIVVECDLYNGNGSILQVIYSRTFTTQSIIKFDNDKTYVAQDTIYFDTVMAYDQDAFGAITKAELLNFEGSVVAEGDGSTRSFEGLDLGSYNVRITYTYMAADGTEQVASVVSDDLTLAPHGIALEGTLIECDINPELLDMRGPIICLVPADEGGRVFAAMDGVVTYNYEMARGIISGENTGFTTFFDITYTLQDKKPYTIRYVGLDMVPKELEIGTEISAGDFIGVAKNTEACTAQETHVHIVASGWPENTVEKLFEKGYFVISEGSKS